MDITSFLPSPAEFLGRWFVYRQLQKGLDAVKTFAWERKERLFDDLSKGDALSEKVKNIWRYRAQLKHEEGIAIQLALGRREDVRALKAFYDGKRKWDELLVREQKIAWEARKIYTRETL